MENKIEENSNKTITILTDESKDVIKELLSKNIINEEKENLNDAVIKMLEEVEYE